VRDADGRLIEAIVGALLAAALLLAAFSVIAQEPAFSPRSCSVISATGTDRLRRVRCCTFSTTPAGFSSPDPDIPHAAAR
jgi:ABC-type amino acid transport substrate-binding protein